LVRPRSTGRIRLTGPKVTDVLAIDTNMLSDPADMAALVSAMGTLDKVARSASLRNFIKRRVTPHSLERHALEQFLRESVVSLWHQTCTAKMGEDEDSVVDSKLRVHGLVNLTVADGSVLRHVTTGNTMAPCVIVGERAALSVMHRYFGRDG
jgi:choline dehydrogenase